MLQRTIFAEDSDQSISEEEDLGPDWPENCILLGETAEKKGGIQIQSQLQILRDSHGIVQGKEASNVNKGNTGSSSEDEVEVPFFHDGDDFLSSPGTASISNLNEDLISDNEKTGYYSGGKQLDGACTWSAVNKETEELVHLNENVRSSLLHLGTSHIKETKKGNRCKGKQKLSFRFRSHREDINPAIGSKLMVDTSSRLPQILEELQAADRRTEENVMAEPLVQRRRMEESTTSGVVEHGFIERSMVDLLDNYQEKAEASREDSRMMVYERSITSKGSEEPPDALDSGSSSDDESFLPMKAQKFGVIITSSNQKTMTDKFQEAFGAVAVNEEGPDSSLHGTSIFEKLQHVMQNEKKREMDFLKRLQTAFSSIDETSCIDVEILSRCLEAKLTVCRCSLSKEEHARVAQSSQIMKGNHGRALTVIFSPRVCDDVELEVGSLIRIYSPWKEVQVQEKDELIILSAYFSQILS